jgi:hypothetical protein
MFNLHWGLLLQVKLCRRLARDIGQASSIDTMIEGLSAGKVRQMHWGSTNRTLVNQICWIWWVCNKGLSGVLRTPLLSEMRHSLSSQGHVIVYRCKGLPLKLIEVNLWSRNTNAWARWVGIRRVHWRLIICQCLPTEAWWWTRRNRAIWRESRRVGCLLRGVASVLNKLMLPLGQSWWHIDYSTTCDPTLLLHWERRYLTQCHLLNHTFCVRILHKISVSQLIILLLNLLRWQWEIDNMLWTLLLLVNLLIKMTWALRWAIALLRHGTLEEAGLEVHFIY